MTCWHQTGTILVPDFVTTILNLMTGMGLLGVAAVVRSCHPPLESKLPPLMCVKMQVVGVMIESVLPVFQSRFGYGCARQSPRFIFKAVLFGLFFVDFDCILCSKRDGLNYVRSFFNKQTALFWSHPPPANQIHLFS